MTPSGRTFRVFVSSTFSDLKAERDYLRERVFPRLRELCAQHGCRFHAIDLRWGVSEEAALDQQTMNICSEELKRCQRTSPRPNFIVLLGQRYGWRPLPSQIDAAEFELLLGAMPAADDRELLRCPEFPAQPQPGVHWYRRDDNADPPEYVLRPREVTIPEGSSREHRAVVGDREAADWRHLESEMRRILLNAAKHLGWSDSDPRRAKYERSATHLEIEAGALSPALERPEEHVFGFLREIVDLPRDSSAAAFIDLDEQGRFDGEAADRLQQLKTMLKNRLRENTVQNDGSIHSYSATWTGTRPTDDHLPNLGKDVFRCLSGVILKEVARLDRWVDDPETRAHETFRSERVRVFEGRDDLLGRIRAYVSGTDQHPLVLHGPPGSGKTALMAKAAAEVTNKAAAGQTTKRVCRFIGATATSTSLRSLLEDLCQRIAPSEGALPGELRELGQEFVERLEQGAAEQVVVVWLDALDQLGEADGARSLWWLPTTLPANVRMIVSVVDVEGGQGECYRGITRRVPPRMLLAVGPLAAADGERILDQLLNRANRRLQPAQWADVIGKFSASETRLPLYLKLAFEEVRRWRSFDGLPVNSNGEPGVGADISRVLKDLLGRLARHKNHGTVFTARALGYLAAGRHGLTEDELVDVVSEDADVLRDFEQRSPNSPTISRLPLIVWSRLRADVEAYLTERLADGTTVLNFYHREVRAAVEAWCLGGDKGILAHQGLANYFGGQDCFLESIYEQRFRAKQFPPTSRPANRRKVGELVWQRLRGAQAAEAATLLTDLSFLEAKIEAGMVFGLVNDFTDYLRLGSAEDPRRRHIQLLLRALRRDAFFIARHAHTMFQCVWNSGWWYDCAEAAQRYESTDGPSTPPGDKLSTLLELWRDRKERATPGFVWVRSKRPPAMSLASAELAVLRGHDGAVTSVAVTPDGTRILSGSDDQTVRLWDVGSGSVLAVLRGHARGITSVAATSDGTRIISGSYDQTVRVWDADSGAPLAVLRGHENAVTSVATTLDNRIISGSRDGTVRVWDTRSGADLAVLRGHEGEVTSVAVTPDGSRIISGSYDKTVRVWEVGMRTALAVLQGGGHWVSSVAVTPDGTRIISGSHDRTVRVWDTGSGTELAVLRGHEGSVSSVSTTPDGARIISGGHDQTVRVWDVASGERLAVLRGHDHSVEGVAITPDLQVVSGSVDGTVRLWDASDSHWAVLRDYEASINVPAPISSLAVTPNGAMVTTGSWDTTVRLWDGVSGVQLAVLRGHEGEVTSVSPTPDGTRVISGSEDKTVRVWDAGSGAELAVLRGHQADVEQVLVTPDGARIISGSHDRTVRVWDVSSGAELAVLRGHAGTVTTVLTTSDGTRIISGSEDKTVRVWPAGGLPAVVLRGHDDYVTAIAVTPDGGAIVSGSVDKTVRVWHATTGAAMAVLRGHDGGVENVAVTSDGSRIIGSDGKTILVWDGKSGECLEVIQGRGDISAIAAGPSRFPFRALTQSFRAQAAHSETVIEDSTSGRALAWFPVALAELVTQPDGRAWVGASVTQIYLLALEGEV